MKHFRRNRFVVGIFGVMAGSFALNACVSSSVEQTLNVTDPEVSGPKASGQNVTGQNVSDPKVTGQNVSGPKVTDAKVSGPKASGSNGLQENNGGSGENLEENQTTTVFGENLDDGRKRSSKEEVDAAIESLKQRAQNQDGAVASPNSDSASRRARALKNQTISRENQILREIENSGEQ